MKTKHLRPTWLLLALLVLLTLASPLGSNAFVGGEVIPGTEQTMPGASGQYIDISGRIDAAANSFVAIATHDPLNNNITWVELRRYSPAGAVTWYDEARPKAPNFKIENIDLHYSGSTLILQMTVHTFGTGPRIRRAEQVPFPGVFTYRVGMELEEGAPGVFQPQAPTGLTEPDFQRIQQMITTDGNSTRNALRGAVQAEIRASRVITEGMFNGEFGSWIVYSQLRATSYSGSLDALGKYGACRAP
jgi:hypothetical protein